MKKRWRNLLRRMFWIRYETESGKPVFLMCEANYADIADSGGSCWGRFLTGLGHDIIHSMLKADGLGLSENDVVGLCDILTSRR